MNNSLKDILVHTMASEAVYERGIIKSSEGGREGGKEGAKEGGKETSSNVRGRQRVPAVSVATSTGRAHSQGSRQAGFI